MTQRLLLNLDGSHDWLGQVNILAERHPEFVFILFDTRGEGSGLLLPEGTTAGPPIDLPGNPPTRTYVTLWLPDGTSTLSCDTEMLERIELPDHHPGWRHIHPSGDHGWHWIQWDRSPAELNDDGEPMAYRLVCDAEVGADCRWTCDQGCESFPCHHAPAPADCWLQPWVNEMYDGSMIMEGALEEGQLEDYGRLDAYVTATWEGDYATIAYKLRPDGSVVTR